MVGVLGFFTGKTMMGPQDPTLGAIAIEMDAVVAESTDYKVTVTEHPIEDGSVIADHVRDEPDELSIDGIVTSTPASILDAAAALATGQFNRHEDAWGWLYAYLKTHALMTVTTSIKTWENMVIASLKRTRSADVGEALSVSIKLKQITKVVAIEVGVPTRPPGTQTGKSTVGTITTKGVDAAANGSILGFLLKAAVAAVK